MFFPEDVERQILHDSTNRIKYSDKPLIKRFNNAENKRNIGGSAKAMGDSRTNGVSTLKPPKVLKSSSMSGGGKKKPSVWQTLIKNTMGEKQLTMKEAIKYIKDNNLY